MEKRSLVALAVAFTLVCGLAQKPASAVDKPAAASPVVNGAAPADEKAAHRSASVSPSSLNIGNQYVKAKIASDGRFNFGLSPAGNDRFYNISFEWPYDPWTSMTTVRVDGANNVLSTGGQTQPPSNTSGLSNDAGWRFGDIEVRQTISIIPGRVDAAEIRYTLTNRGAAAHNVGLRILLDTMISNNDGAPYRIPGASGDLEVVTKEREYSGADVPAFWRAFHDLNDPNVSAQWTLRGDGITPPDRMATARWNWIHLSPWDYRVDTNSAITVDSAVAMWWNQQALAPGQTRTFVQYYGAPGRKPAAPPPPAKPVTCPGNTQPIPPKQPRPVLGSLSEATSAYFWLNGQLFCDPTGVSIRLWKLDDQTPSRVMVSSAYLAEAFRAVGEQGITASNLEYQKDHDNVGYFSGIASLHDEVVFDVGSATYENWSMSDYGEKTMSSSGSAPVYPYTDMDPVSGDLMVLVPLDEAVFGLGAAVDHTPETTVIMHQGATDKDFRIVGAKAEAAYRSGLIDLGEFIHIRNWNIFEQDATSHGEFKYCELNEVACIRYFYLMEVVNSGRRIEYGDKVLDLLTTNLNSDLGYWGGAAAGAWKPEDVYLIGAWKLPPGYRKPSPPPRKPIVSTYTALASNSPDEVAEEIARRVIDKLSQRFPNQTYRISRAGRLPYTRKWVDLSSYPNKKTNENGADDIVFVVDENDDIQHTVFVEVKYTIHDYVSPYRFDKNAPWYRQLDRSQNMHSNPVARENLKLLNDDFAELQRKAEMGEISPEEFRSEIAKIEEMRIAQSGRGGHSVAAQKRYDAEGINYIGLDLGGAIRSMKVWRLFRWGKDKESFEIKVRGGLSSAAPSRSVRISV